MKAFPGVRAYPGYAIGEAFVVSTWNDLLAIGMAPMPVIVVAPYLEERMIDVIDLRRVYGFVVSRGSVIDPVHDKLSEVTKPSLVGCAGAYEEIRTGRTVAIDTDQEVCVLEPEGRVLEYLRARKGTRARRLEPLERSALDRLAGAVRGAWFYKGWTAPLDLPDDRGRLVAIARKVAAGQAPSPEEDEYVKSLMDPPEPPPEARAFMPPAAD